jgi:hypothetical protein
MKRMVVVAVAAVAGVAAHMASASGQADGEIAPVHGIKIPNGYRDWKVISVAHIGPPSTICVSNWATM